MQAESYWDVPTLDTPHQYTDRRENGRYLTRNFKMTDPDFTSIGKMRDPDFTSADKMRDADFASVDKTRDPDFTSTDKMRDPDFTSIDITI